MAGSASMVVQPQSDKPPGAVASLISVLAGRLDVAAGVLASIVYLWLPAVLGLKYSMVAPRGPYQLMWLNLLGANYRLNIETPKPLSVLLAGLLGSGIPFYVVTCALVGVCVWASVRLGKAITGSYWPGTVAAVTIFALRGTPIYLILIGGTEPFHIALVLLSVLALAAGRFPVAALAVFGACLQRPESWSLAPVPLLLSLIKRRRFHVLLLLPFAAPLVWAAFDRRMTGDWFYSLHETAYYRVAAALSASPTGSFLGDITLELAKVAGDVPFIVGLLGLGIWIWTRARAARGAAALEPESRSRSSGELTAGVCLAIVLPLAASGVASLSGRVLQMGRFHYPSVTLITLFAVSAPFLVFAGRAPRWVAVALSAAVGLSAFAPSEVARSVRMARVDEVRATAYYPIAGTVTDLLSSGSAEVAVVSQRRLDYFGRLLGPANSWKLLTVREVRNLPGTIPTTTRSGILAYYDQDEINLPPTDSVIRWVTRAWPTPAVLERVAATRDGRGGVWTIRSAP